jgi:DNA-directed RNA polymerase specialized sigma24 family protein
LGDHEKVNAPSEDEFRYFVERVEPKLHRALVAQFGWHTGREAAAAALGYAWEHWGELLLLENPIGYLFRVGQSSIRSRKTPEIFERPYHPEQWFEPSLARLLSNLPESQRIAVILVHGYGWTTREVAELTGIKPTTVQSHLERALRKLRSQLEVTNNA